MVQWCAGYIQSRLVPSLKELADTHYAQDRQDRAPPVQQVNHILARARAAFLLKFPVKAQLRVLHGVAAQTEAFQRKQLTRQVQKQIGIPLTGVLNKGLNKAVQEFTAVNVALIQTIPATYFSQVESTVLEGLKSGKRAAAIAVDIQERTGVAQSHAALIARDQVGKFNGDLNKLRQTNLGVTRFVWHTMEDERVRDSHEDLDDGVYDWDDPPDGDDGPTIPGQDINCRCYAEPVLEFGDEG